MALIQHACNKLNFALGRANIRFYSKTALALEKNIKKSIFFSQSTDIYTNLALEEWLYKNFDFKQHHVLLLYRNDPSVVLGKNQNPWSETNFSDLPNLAENGVKLARRSGGGGATYHDNGSLSLTFFAPRERFNSKKNSQIVARSIFRELGGNVDLGAEDNLLLRKNKLVSSNSAKLGRLNSYYNLSLMLRTDKVNRNIALKKHDVNIKSKAVQKTSATNVMNLCEDIPQVEVSSLMKFIGQEFLRTTALTLKDGGELLASKQNGFSMINPSEGWFPGIQEIRDKFASWDWCYGETPKFHITKTFSVPGDIMMHRNSSATSNLSVTMTVERGLISDIYLFVPYEIDSFGFTGEAKVVHSLKGKKFSVEAFEDLEDSLGCLLDKKDRFVTECLKQVMSCA